ncbi:hypothetical protein GW17_00020324, partial [Ensete ventricosum]
MESKKKKQWRQGWQGRGLAAMATLPAEEEIGEGQRSWPVMATAAGKRLGSA